MSENKQTERLTKQQLKTRGVIGIFNNEAKAHDSAVGKAAALVLQMLAEEFPQLIFRHRPSVTKKEINEALQRIDTDLGQTIFLPHSCIKPDGGIVEVRDDSGNWRPILISEAKHQGKDIQNIEKGIKVGEKKDKDLMVAGNAIERAHKNISEIANFMLSETYFPYVVFLEGTNFLTEDVVVRRPNGECFTIKYDAGTLNRLDRITAANYGMAVNKNLCLNKFVQHKEHCIMLQAASIFTQGNGASWNVSDMAEIMLDIARTSLRSLSSDLFGQLTK